MTVDYDDFRPEYLAQIAGMIEKRGWAIQAVAGPAASQTFCYTVGLTAKGLPEFWVATLAPQQAGLLLNAFGDRLVADGKPPPVGEDIDIGWSTRFRVRGPVRVDRAEVFVASAVYEAVDVTVLQILWPDEAGKFPDDAGYDSLRFPQRLLPELVSPLRGGAE